VPQCPRGGPEIGKNGGHLKEEYNPYRKILWGMMLEFNGLGNKK